MDSWSILDARGSGVSSVIPGAKVIGWPELAMGTPLAEKSVLLSASELLAKLATVGIDRSRPVVVYGSWQQGWGEEGRLFWILDYLGFMSSGLRCLDGGIDAWTAAGFAVEPPQVASPSGISSDESLAENRRATTSYMEQLVSDDSQVSSLLLDVREEDEFIGSQQNQYDAPRSGHIPGATWWNWKANVFNGEALRSCEEIRSSLPAEVTTADEIITYCTGGIRSAFTYMVLRGCGFGTAGSPHLRNYDGSWWAWSSNSSLPCVGDGYGCPHHSTGQIKASSSDCTNFPRFLLLTLGMILLRC
jgi:thiosulfate/3-mercaptopyruvate sulfurtransferase